MTPSPVYVGIDVSKHTLDVFVPGSGHSQFDNTSAGRGQLLDSLSAQPNAILCCEASGGYEQPLLQACFERDTDIALVMAHRVRHWARSQGIRAKTDRLDAQAIAGFARASQPRRRTPPSPQKTRLRALVRRRHFEVERRTALRLRLPQEQERDLRREAQRQLRSADRFIALLEQRIDQLIESTEELRCLAQRLEQPKGIGRLTSATVIAEVPRLGQLGGQAMAAFCGLAPFNYDSGPYRGRRRIWGGNARLRRAFYLAALSASRHNPVLRVFYRRLRDHGKDPKLALIAVARKLCRLVERIAADPSFEPAPAPSRARVS